MRSPKIGFTALISLLTAISIPFTSNFSALLFSPQALAQIPDDRKVEADRVLQQGLQQYQTSQFQAALRSWQHALTIYQQIGDKAREATTLNNIGAVYRSQGQYPKALEFFQQALEISKKVGDRAGEGTHLANIGSVYYFLGQYSQALKSLQQGLAIFRKVGDRRIKGETLTTLGLVYDKQSQYLQALESHQQALAIFRKIGYRDGEGTALANIGLAYNNQDQYPKALQFYQQALAVFREVGNKAGVGQLLNNMGAVYNSLNQYPKALQFYQQALAIVREVGDRTFEGTTLNNIGFALLQTGKFAEATETLRDGIEVWESLRPGLSDTNRVSIFEQQATTYGFLQQAFVAQQKTNTALEVAERGRARAFVELLSTRLSSQPTIHSSFAHTAPPTIQQIQQIAKQQNATLVEYSTTYDAIKVQGKEEWRQSELYIWVIKPTGEVAFRSVNLKPLWQQKKLLKDLVAKARESVTQDMRSRGTSNQLTFSPGDLVRLNDDYLNWKPWQVVAVNAQNSTLKLKHPSFKEGVTIEKSQADVVEKVTPSYTKNPHLQQLHQLLIQPIADLLPTDPNSRVVFIPQDSLFLVPFPALQDASGKYLIEQHTITTAPAIQVLDLTHRQKQRVSGLGKDALVVGNPIMPKVSQVPGQEPQQLESLPHAQQEAIDIAQMLQTKAITGSQASEAAIVQQLPKAGLIHLATHGLLNDFTSGGVPGAIALAPSGTDDGLLTSEEILDLQLQAELVVLSACDTGLGRITGDGIIGLSRSLFAAGVPSVIVSLWSMQDAPTAPLMKEFYQQLQSNPNKSQALRNAMLKTMKKYPDPRD